MKYEDKAKALALNYRKDLDEAGIGASEPVKGNYCYEITASLGSDKIKVLSYFSSKGNKTVIQGNPESLFYRKVYSVVFGASLFTIEEENPEPGSYIGTDESGKGDFFGPLVTAGVYVDKKISEELRRIGVRDSKTLNDQSIRKMEGEIKKITENKFNIVVINPERYNQLYDQFGNLNKMLGWAHARVLENLLNIQDTDTAISDKFGDEKFILFSLQAKGKQLRLMQFHRAEKYTAVAAASILARGRMVKWFEAAEKEYGMEIPKGASPAVEAAAKEIKEKFGDEVLLSLTKKHFKTTNRI